VGQPLRIFSDRSGDRILDRGREREAQLLVPRTAQPDRAGQHAADDFRLRLRVLQPLLQALQQVLLAAEEQAAQLGQLVGRAVLRRQRLLSGPGRLRLRVGLLRRRIRRRLSRSFGDILSHGFFCYSGLGHLPLPSLEPGTLGSSVSLSAISVSRPASVERSALSARSVCASRASAAVISAYLD